jgi:DNA polymerase (family 10)
MARHIHANYPAYEYIVMTDHSQSSRIAGGMKPDAFKRQFDEIDRVNRDLGMDLVKKGVEVDILSNGSLDLPDELLASFDWVTASIHSGFANDNTKRLMNACRHPLVNCIGHPSGRLIGRREAYKVDWDTLFGHAAETGTALEINGQQERLDLSDLLVRDALNAGVCLTVSTDAHDPQQFELMSLGIGVARRGWCSKDNILNTRQWGKVEKFRDAKRSGS